MFKFLPMIVATFVLAACEGGLNLDDEASPLKSGNSGQTVPPPSSGWPYLGIGEKFRWTSGSGQAVEATVAEGDLAPSGDCLAGTGRLRFPRRPQIDDAWNLKLNLRWSLGSAVRVDLHAESDGNRAVELLFRRENLGLKSFVSADNETRDWSNIAGLKSLLEKDEVDFSIDIHHDQNHRQFAHLLLFDSQNRLVMDSGLDTDGVPGKGHGTDLWIVLEKTELCGIQFSSPVLAD